jgi:RNA recognition motif-containing protein
MVLTIVIFEGGLFNQPENNMSKSIYVGNLPYAWQDADLGQIFADTNCDVKNAKIIIDRDTGRSKGFGFVEIEDDAQALAAIEQLNGRNINGRDLRVNEAREREPRSGGYRPRR